MIVNRFADPAYAAAVKKENDVRDAALLGLTTQICGIEIRQMTGRDLLILDGIGSPFISGGIPEATEVIDFIWHLSPSYCARAPVKAFLFTLKHRGIDAWEVIKSIRQYIEDTFQDSQGGGGVNAARHAGWLAGYVDEFASEYGWTMEQIMDLPLKVVYQLDNCIRKRYDRDATFASRSSKVTRDRLRLKNQRLQLLKVLRSRN